MADDEIQTAEEDSEAVAGEMSSPELLHGVPVSDSRGQIVLHPSREEYAELVRRLRDEGYWMCVDICGVDYLSAKSARELPIGTTAERFEVAVTLLNHTERARLRLRVQIPETDPRLDSIVAVHPTAENLEREVFDMFGIRFEGHPDLSRILMPDDWEGFPLRKDYSVGNIPVQFKEAPTAR